MKLHLCFYLIEAIYLYKKYTNLLFPGTTSMLLTDVSLLTRVDFDFLKKKKKKRRKRKIDFELRSFIWCSVGILYMFELLVAFWSEAKRIRKYIYIYIVGGEEEPPHRFMTAAARWGDLTSPFDIRFQILIIQQMRKKKKRVKIWPPQVFDCFIGRLSFTRLGGLALSASSSSTSLVQPSLFYNDTLSNAK